jgi:hypothetical protein
MQLIVKECKVSLRIQKYEALGRRIVANHPIRPILADEYHNWMAGYKGEKSLEYHLSMLPEEKYLIFHNIRLLLGKYYFQMDYLLLCAAFGLVLEVKNRKGTYLFEKYLNQVSLKTTEKDERIKNPVLQAKLQATKLKKWLTKHNFPAFPIHCFFVNSNNRAIIRTDPGNEQILRNICNSESLVEKITHIESFEKKEMVDTKTLRKMKRLILSSDTPETFDILKHFLLSLHDILTGVQCPDCGFLSMNYKYGIWSCPNCQCHSKTAHIQAIRDYFLLIKPSITNSELREFLHIDSPRVANKILRQLNLPSEGTFKGRIYFPKAEWL